MLIFLISFHIEPRFGPPEVRQNIIPNYLSKNHRTNQFPIGKQPVFHPGVRMGLAMEKDQASVKDLCAHAINSLLIGWCFFVKTGKIIILSLQLTYRDLPFTGPSPVGDPSLGHADAVGA